MKVELWQIGKTSFNYLQDGIALYEKRLKRYLPFSIYTFPDVKQAKSLSEDLIKEKEGASI